jgi:uncharacterized membrane protein YhaH (DUF805 family)
MFNLFFGFSGRLRRREFILWSFVVPLALVVPPVAAMIGAAQSENTSFAEDLASSGMAWPLLMMVLLSNYISVALFWKRIQDADETKLGRFNSGVTRWGYALLTFLNSLVIGLYLIALGQIEGSFAGVILLGFWSMACWQKPHNGPNRFGPDPRNDGASAAFDDVSSASSLKLEAAMQRALDERDTKAVVQSSPKSVRMAKPVPAMPAGKPSFGRRGA